jgi:hypothetical protein
MAIVFPRVRLSFTQDSDSGLITGNTCRVCAGSCEYEMNASGGKTVTGPYTATDSTLSNLCTPSAVTVNITHDSFSVIGNRFLVYCFNGVTETTVYDSSCVTGSVTSSFTVPAQTQQLRVAVIGACSGSGDDLWSFSIYC